MEFDAVEEDLKDRSQTQNFDAEVWKQARETIYTQTQEILSNDSSPEDVYVLLDDNFYYKSMRKPYYRLAAEFNKTSSDRVIIYCEILVEVSTV